MKLDEFYTVEPDTSCWTLTYEKVGPEKNEKGDMITSRSATYHASLKQALVKYLDNALKPSEDVQTALNRITEVERMIEKDVLTITWAQIAETVAESTKEEMRNRKERETK